MSPALGRLCLLVLAGRTSPVHPAWGVFVDARRRGRASPRGAACVGLFPWTSSRRLETSTGESP
jgi:hypothetical protein